MRAIKRHTPQPISDDLWAAIEPLIPARSRSEGKSFRRRPGAGRKPIPARKAFEAVVHVLRTGTPWKSLPRSFGSASAIHRHFDAWDDAGLFHRIWEAGLAEHDEFEGIAWLWRESAELSRRYDSSASRSSHRISSREGADRYAVRPRAWQPALARRRRRRRTEG